MSTEKSTLYSQDGGGIMPLRPSDLVFNKTPDGIVSCGYTIKNALLNSTLNAPSQSGGSNKIKLLSNNSEKTNINKLKIMEDLVVPSSLYYCRPIYKHKVFNCKKGVCENVDKKNKNKNRNKDKSDDDNEYEEEYYDSNVVDESLYDKLLSLVSPGKRMRYDNKTRKVINSDSKGKQSKTVTKKVKVNDNVEMGDTRETGENVKILKNKNTTKNANISKNKRTRKIRFVMP